MLKINFEVEANREHQTFYRFVKDLDEAEKLTCEIAKRLPRGLDFGRAKVKSFKLTQGGALDKANLIKDNVISYRGYTAKTTFRVLLEKDTGTEAPQKREETVYQTVWAWVQKEYPDDIKELLGFLRKRKDPQEHADLLRIFRNLRKEAPKNGPI